MRTKIEEDKSDSEKAEGIRRIIEGFKIPPPKPSHQWLFEETKGDALNDLKKAQWYLNRYIEKKEGKTKCQDQKS